MDWDTLTDKLGSFGETVGRGLKTVFGSRNEREAGPGEDHGITGLSHFFEQVEKEVAEKMVCSLLDVFLRIIFQLIYILVGKIV